MSATLQQLIDGVRQPIGIPEKVHGGGVVHLKYHDMEDITRTEMKYEIGTKCRRDGMIKLATEISALEEAGTEAE